ncbi:MAG: glycosyltransferase family A protein [Candidatus Pacebacteria bacterium]|nr:glycosyltransferase family A protein [Candidatus Paceibacterota bacterium]
MPNLKASVIIPTLNRKQYLLQTLGFLEKQDFIENHLKNYEYNEK